MGVIYTNSRASSYVDVGSAGSLSNRILSMETAADFNAVGDALPNPDIILQNAGEKIDVYRRLEYDTQVAAAQGQVTDGIKSQHLDIIPKKAPRAVVKACELWLDKINLPNFIDQAIGARWYGFQVIEAIWQEYQGTLLPIVLDALPAKWFAFDKESHLLFKSKNNQEGEPVEEQNPNKFLVLRHGASYTNPYGVGGLSRCLWPVAFKKGGKKFWMYFIEKYGMPWTIIKVPSNTPDDVRIALLEMGKRMIQDAVSVINDTDQMEYKESASKGASADLYLGFLKYCDAEISKAIVGQTATTEGTAGNLGSEAERGDVLVRGIISAASLIEEAINTIFGWIAQVHGGTDLVPEAKFYSRDEVQKSRAERDNLLIGMGLKLTSRYFADKYYIEEEYIAVDDLDTPVKAETPDAVAEPNVQSKQNGTDGAQPDTNDGLQDTGLNAEDGGAGFAEGIPDEDALDLLVQSFSNEEYQGSVETLLKPVLDLIQNAKSYSEVEKKLAPLYPKMDADELQSTIGKLMFMSEVKGRIEAAAETEEADA